MDCSQGECFESVYERLTGGRGGPFLYSTRKVLSYPRTWIKFSADWSGPVLCQLP